ncbi:hypothetical protein GXP67_32730 [Rhodocytophaga rosea]|uniref:Uncharacterized protein n=1 Tax=Rhodocytophaga rosea TaxID=2704465 RepID=A0A6C0GUR5_9BACT|nr:hypothetical protein [Rhodocytophaga rosea]QHT71082.1 hypothetical protein GXP67_32730 [Rhodocytophaga rosea]
MRLKLPRVRIAKTYLVEAFMIVFSVLLALMLNEVRNSWMEHHQTEQILSNVQVEIIWNQQIVKKLVSFHNSVVDTI